MKYQDAVSNIHGLSGPSKMPCSSYSISPEHCNMGSRLRKIKGSVCSGCYCLRNNYIYPVVKNAHEKRKQAFNHPKFVESMSWLINNVESSGFFRWFDSGDLQSEEMLQQIVDIVKATPKTKHWLPTKEYGMVMNWLNKGNKIPANLNIRLSAYMIDERGPVGLAKLYGCTVSEVRRKDWTCPAPSQENKCYGCRKCWDKKEMVVSYHKH